MENTEKKSTYNAKAQKKYNQKFRIISAKIPAENYDDIKSHAENKGCKSLNSYILNLIDQDMGK